MATKKRTSKTKKTTRKARTKIPQKQVAAKKEPVRQKKQKFLEGLHIKNPEKEVEKHAGWELNKAQTTITKSYTFPSFISALAFVAKVAVHAEVLDHHPDIELSYGKVKVKLTTHKTASLTKLDLALAERIDGIKNKEK